MLTQSDKGAAFRALHAREGAFIIPNPWDIGSARLLAQLGFEALATTSAGLAFSRGLPDGAAGRDISIAHAAEIVAAVGVPVSADLENGFGDDAETVAETVRRAAATGLAGCSIEDSTGRADEPLYELAHAVDRIRAAVEVVRGLPFPFTLTARAENFLVGRADLGDTIARLQAYQEAGADVLFAPGLATDADITAVVRAVDRPVNVVMGLSGGQFTQASLSALGVKRISVGGSLARAAYGAFLRAAQELKTDGGFTYGTTAIPHREINTMFREMASTRESAR